MKPKRQRRIEGDILLVDLGDGWRAFARVLKEPLMAFYDLRVKDEVQVAAVLTRPTLFKVWVMNKAVTSGRWRRIGNAPLEGPLMVEPRFFRRDRITKTLHLYRQVDGQFVDSPMTAEECEGLEAAAVWDPEHVEDRLRDHFAGRQNQWVLSLRP